MHLSKLRNRFNKNKPEDNFIAYKQQRYKCIKILRKTKRNCYGNLELKHLTDNRKFWKPVKPVFTDTVQVSQSVTLIEKAKL